MKKGLRVMLLLVVLCGLALSAGAEIPMVSGQYAGEADGFSTDTPIKVILTLQDGVITQAEAIGEGEHARIAAEALKQLPQQMVQRNSIELDSLTGATWTSKGIINAARQALDKARQEEIQNGNGQNGPLIASGSAFGWSTTHPVIVTITVEQGVITQVDTKAWGEHATIGLGALEQLKNKVIQNNSIAVDNITGATWTSAGFLAAAQSAMNRLQIPYDKPDIASIADFKTLRWGDNEGDVLALEGEAREHDSVKGQDLYYLSYTDELAGLDMELTYYFTARQLFRARYQSQAVHADPGQYLNDYQNLKQHLTESLGKPKNDEEIWLVPKPDAKINKEAALFSGSLMYHTQFEKDRSSISLSMHADDYRVKLRVVYQDLEVKPEEGGY